MAQQDDLAQLFAQSMFLHHRAPVEQHQREQYPQSVDEVSETPINPNPVHFASAHYTQTAHVRAESGQSRSPPPPYNEVVMPATMAEMLRQHSIDPLALLPHQICLFANADYEQRLRLLELWRISPPTFPLEKHVGAPEMVASVEREEQEARTRYEQQMRQRVGRQEDYMLDTFIVEPTSQNGQPIEYSRHSAACMRSAAMGPGEGPLRTADVEPYIVNGYEMAASQRAVDPVYASGLWQAPSYADATRRREQKRSVEDQYGLYEQIRNHADWERINEHIAREKSMEFHSTVSMDEDMVM